MDSYDRYGMYAGGDITINNTYVTNVMNVAQAANVCDCGGWRPGKNRRRKHGKGRDRRPKLQHFCETFGIEDREKALGMSKPEFALESANVVGYNMRAAGRSARGIGRDLSYAAGGACKMVTSAFGMLAALFK